MALKKYAYYNKGNKFAIVESELSAIGGRNLAVAHCTIGGYTTQAECEAAGGQWIPGSGASELGMTEKYISPTEAVTDGIEIEYAYAPTYRINDASETVNVNSLTEAAGTFRLTLSDNVSLAVDNYVYISGHPLISGLHRVRLAATGSSTLFLTTKYNGGSVSFSDPKPVVYHDVTALSDEDSEVDLSEYQAQAVVYYLKAKLAEDVRDVDGREYFMKLFKKQMEKAASSKKRGPHIMRGFM